MKKFMKKVAACVMGAVCLVALAPASINNVSAATSDGQKKVYKNHTYAVYGNASSWEDAKERCEKMGGHLVTITSKGENTFAYNLVKDAGYEGAAIGLYNAGTYENQKWKWVTGEKVSYTNWQVGQPSGSYGGTENYGEFYQTDRSDGWNDGRDIQEYMNAYVCEWDYSVKFAETSITLSAKDSTWIDYSVAGTTKGNKMTFKSSNVKVAKVSSKGKVVAVKSGTCKITCKFGKMSKTIKVVVTPGKPSGLKVLAKDKTSVRLTWNKENSASKYQIYMYDPDLSEYTLVKTQDGSFNSATIQDLSKNTKYTFKIRYYMKSGSKKYYSKFSKTVTVKTKK
jgi:hypothetical protein